MTGGTYRLYGRLGAGSLAPQIVLEEIGAPYELVWVGTDPTEVEAFRRVNPRGKIPLLVLPDGTSVSESAAILVHLTNAHPAAKPREYSARSTSRGAPSRSRPKFLRTGQSSRVAPSDAS